MGVESASIWCAKLNSISWPYLEVRSFGYDGNDDTTSPINLEHFLNFEKERHGPLFMSVSPNSCKIAGRMVTIW